MGDNLQEMTNHLPDAQKHQAEKELKELEKKIKTTSDEVKGNVKILRASADYLDKVFKDCKIARASGTSAGILGGAFTIGAGIATIMTAGAAMPLLIAGFGFGAAGALTNVGTSAVESAINSTQIEEADKKLQKTLEAVNDVRNTIKQWQNYKDAAELLYMLYLAKKLGLAAEVIDILLTVLRSITTLPVDIAKAVGNFVTGTGQATVQAGAKACAQCAGDLTESGVKAGSKAGGKLAGKLVIGISVLFLVVDVIDLTFTIRDLVQNKGSDAAIYLRAKADELEKIL